MGMSSHTVGFRPADEKWKRMKTIWTACAAAGVPVPKEVELFFDGEPPGDKPGAEVQIEAAVKKWGDDYRQGFEVDLTKLPPDVKVLRFYNSF